MSLTRRALIACMVGTIISIPLKGSAEMAVFGNFTVTDYEITNGLWVIHLVNLNPGGGNATDYYVEFELSEVPANINQNTLANQIKTRLGQKYNATYAPLNTAIANGMTITLP